MVNNSISTHSSSPVPSISSSVIDQNKSLNNSVQGPVQNDRGSDGSSDDDDENSTSVVNRSTTTTAAKAKSATAGAGKKQQSNAQTPKRAANKRNHTNVSKDVSDENENCRVSMPVVYLKMNFLSQNRHIQQ